MMEKLEILSRAWIACDPNRVGADPDAPIPEMGDSEGNTWTTDLTGKPRWHWFVPRAEALEAFIESHGYRIVKK